MTLRDAAAWGAGTLRSASELARNAARDAELLLLYRLALTRSDLRIHPERVMPDGAWYDYQTLIARRMRMEPIQYITGEREFYGLRLKVTRAVLIPRPETELLVEQVLAVLSTGLSQRVLDVGTGSGAIAIALAMHSPAEITAVDLSREALAVAVENAEAHGVSSRIRFLESDLLSAVSEERFDLIVSNPPYVPLVDRSSLHPEVREHEPALALFAGASGMDIYRRLIPQAWAALNPGGTLAMEIGFGQRDAVAELLREWRDAAFHDDLQGIPRVVLARRHA